MEQCKDCETFNQRDECVGDGHEHACCHFVKKSEHKPEPKFYIDDDGEMCRNYYDEDDF